MPSLNRELLFDIGRKLVEDNEQDAVYRYGLSGKASFEILRNIFASVKVLKLFNDHYAIGWDNRKLCRFNFNGPHLKLLLNYVGEPVKDLHLGCKNMPMYSSVISKVISAKNISSFTADVKSDYIFASVLFASISNTLEEVKIPHNFLHEKFVQLPLTFDTVTILDNQMADGTVFNFKRVSLTISSDFCAKMSSFTNLSFTSNISQSAAFADVNLLFIMKNLWFLDGTYDFDKQNDDGPLLKCYHKTFTFDKSHDTVFEIRIDQRR
uniref:Uncharacterized protein n=1 Tax=Panagrolaimus sp. PS1159 TaxID=55785 RepID=A0AC35F9B4_9BILA